MKLKALTTVLVAASIAASAAAAGNPPVRAGDHGRGAKSGHQQPSAMQQACKGRQFLLRGLYVSGSAAEDGTGSFVVAVKRTDRLGKRLKLVGTEATVSVDARTKVLRRGEAVLGDLQANDRVTVVVRACKPAAGSDAAPALLARAVVARPAVPIKVDPEA